MLSSLAIAQEALRRPITEIAETAGLLGSDRTEIARVRPAKSATEDCA